MKRRGLLSPLLPGSRTPEEFRAAVKAACAGDKALTDAERRGRLRSMEKRKGLPPVVRSPRRAAIEAAVEKVIAQRKTAVGKKGSSGDKKPAPSGQRGAPK